MATLSYPQKHYSLSSMTGTKLSLWAVPVGRFFFSLIFLFSGINHFSSGSIGYAASKGIPLADVLVPITGVMILVGGLSVLLGYFARAGALLLILFLVPVTFTMHAFWTITDPQAAQMEMINFMKNIALLGAALMLAFYGAGPVSIDNLKARNYRDKNSR